MCLSDLNLPKTILDKLKANSIDSVQKICEISRKELKSLGFSYEEINIIAIKLQLNGMNLNKRKNSY